METKSVDVGAGLITGTVEASRWRSYRAILPTGKAGCLFRGNLIHLDLPEGFDQNGPALRRKIGNIGIFLRLFSLPRAILLPTSMVPLMGRDPKGMSTDIRRFAARERLFPLFTSWPFFPAKP